MRSGITVVENRPQPDTVTVEVPLNYTAIVLPPGSADALKRHLKQSYASANPEDPYDVDLRWLKSELLPLL